MSKTATTPRSDPLPIPTGTQDRLEEALSRLPFDAHLSFEPLFEEIERLGRDATGERRAEARALIESLGSVPALRGAIKDPSVLEAHADAVRQLMGFVFPELMEDEALVRAYWPFAPGAFFTTERYREVFGAEGVQISQANGMANRQYFRENMLFAYRILFMHHYGVHGRHRAFVKQIRDTDTGLDRFFMNEGSIRFARVDAGAKAIPPQQEYARLLEMEDLEELQRRLPLEGVTYSGFMYIRYVEITELHNVSLLKSELVVPNALQQSERIQSRLRSILGYDDLEAGWVLRYESRNDLRLCNNRSLLSAFEGCMATVDGSVYEQVLATGEPVFVPDLDEVECDSPVVDLLRSRGFRSVGLIPLKEQDEVIALLELGSKTPERITPAATRKLADLLAPLSVAARREMDEVNSTIARTIKTHCTAIHPSVEWRFEEAAYAYTKALAENPNATFEPIVFESVHPLYGAMDIRGSSDSRNRAIQRDLLEHLALARRTLTEIHAAHPMPLADYYDSALADFETSVADGLSSGDELSVIEFLHSRIEPFLDYLRGSVTLPTDADAKTAVDRYYAQMDASIGILYKQRKRYEDSVALINDTLAAFLDREQEKAQAIYPHYFEKFKTDGVEHSIYVGASMAGSQDFSEIQLKNLRLWQLTLMCDTARLAEQLVADMEVPLRTTPLVLVQSAPLTLQFSPEEKQFVVEGSYNIRYEIIKKRIDKSTIRGTDERLTQPGHLAVIYTQDTEGEEYARYFEYLAGKGYLTADVEQVELHDLQGVSGLRALRAPIVLD
ncbi:MAG: GAF domain-containing protein [Planctomycetota bacterium]|nr:GAF domain-containing protein [Planctomycetota bacterium]